MQKSLTEKERQYDAFISYRHLSDDKRVATSLQRLLEAKRISDQGKRKRHCRVFRDKSELPTSNDLGKDIHTALENSRYLILLCSRSTKDSKWCMEELRYFRSLHGDTNQNVLPVILDGEPDEVLPDILKYEFRQMPGQDGMPQTARVAVEPLCADIRARYLFQKLRKLKSTEYMRLAAPIMGCRFDDLYRRRLRQRFFTGSVASVIALMFGLLLFLLYQSQLTEAAVYSALAGQMMNQENWQASLMYYNEALGRNTSLVSERSMQMLLLQNQDWPCITKMEEGYINGGIVQPGVHGVRGELCSSVGIPCAMDSTAGYYLVPLKENGTRSSYAVFDLDGNQTALVSNVGNVMFDSYEKDYWTFYRTDGLVTLYHPIKDAKCEFIIETRAPFSTYAPISVVPAGDNACLVLDTEKDSLMLYRFDFETQIVTLACSVGLAELFDARYAWESREYGEPCYSGAFYLFCVSPQQDVVLVGRTCAGEDAWSDTVVLQLSDLTSKNVISQDEYALNEIVFCETDACFALSYGNDSDKANTGGYGVIYDLTGEELFNTGIDENTSYYGVAFRDDGSGEAIFWSRSTMRFWNYRTGSEYASAVSLGDSAYISGVTCTADAHCVLADNGQLYFYNIASFKADGALESEFEYIASMEKKIIMEDDTLYLPVDDRFWLRLILENATETADMVRVTVRAVLTDKDGGIFDEREMDYIFSPEHSLTGDGGVFFCYSFPNRMLYLLLNHSELYRIRILTDQERFGDVEEPVVSGMLQGGGVVKDGIIMFPFLNTSSIIYYKDDSVYGDYLGKIRTAGAVKGVCSNWNSIFALVIERHGHDVVEFWDLQKRRCLMDYELGENELVSEARFITESVFEYKTYGEKSVRLQVLANAPDKQARNALRAISGMTMEDGKVLYKREVFDGNLGNWGRYLHVRMR